jgi:hypothetical protein
VEQAADQRSARWLDADPLVELTWTWPDGVVSELSVEPGEQVVERSP